MSVANLLEEGGYAEVEVNAKAMVQMEQLHNGFRIKRTCLVSLALAGTTITLAQTTVVSR